MARTEKDYLLDLWERGICAYCGQQIGEGRRVGSGKKSEGGFCRLECYARYYALELNEKAALVARFGNQQND